MCIFRRRFQEFLRKTRDVQGDIFVECLFKYGKDLSIINNEDRIGFKEAVMVLDRLNQENPFPLMYFIFQLCTIEDQKSASLSMVRDMLKEIKAANTKGKITLLLDSLEFLHVKQGISRLVRITL